MSQDELRKRITDELITSDWALIKPHTQRDAVFIVDQSLDIIDVAYALALDNKNQVALWLQQKLIRKVEQIDIIDYESSKKMQFQAAIVQPFVLIKELVQISHVP